MQLRTDSLTLCPAFLFSLHHSPCLRSRTLSTFNDNNPTVHRSHRTMDNGLISVDRWAGGSQVYFLTHLHSDHTNGLSSSWSKGPLFCSRLTAKLLPFKFPDFDLSLIRILEIGSWRTVSLASLSGSDTRVQVMAIDAHHCPGSVMLLFRGEFGCLLYTGDFRWEATSERARKGRDMLLDALQGDVVDIIYLDNTYCNPSYDFPPRKVAAQQVIDIIVSHPKHDIIIGIDTLGKEDLLLHISRELKIKIWVWPERLQTMHILGYQDIFTTNTTLTRVRAVPRYSFSVETLEILNTMRPTIGIMPSGLPWMRRTLEKGENPFGSSLTSRHEKGKSIGNQGIRIDKPISSRQSVERYHEYIFSVPYSDHSNFEEIKDLITVVQPSSLKGIVSSSSCYIEPMYYLGRICGAKQPAQKLYGKHGRKRREEGVNAGYSKGGNCAKPERKRLKTSKAKFSGVCISRLSLLRKERRGAKISEDNSPD